MFSVAGALTQGRFGKLSPAILNAKLSMRINAAAFSESLAPTSLLK